MNALLLAFGGLQPIVDAPAWVVLLLKLTAILSAAWLAHLAIARTNPRWRVVLWRVTAVGLIAMPAVAWLLPSLEIRVPQPPVVEEPAVAATSPTIPLADPPAAERVPIEWSNKPSDTLDTRAATLLPASPSKQPEPAASSVGAGAALPALPPPETPAPAPALPEPSHIAWPVLLLAGWLGGIVVLGFRLCLGHYRISAIARRAKQTSPWVRCECTRVAEAIGCRRRVEVVRSTEVESPFLCGLRRPLLLLPARMCETSYRKDLPGILAHELAHVRSYDVPWNAALQVIAIAIWLHPLIWRMRKAHLAACELVSDAVSASFVGDVTGYCRTLARVAVDVYTSLPTAGIAMARTSAIGRRLGMLKKQVFHLPLRRRSVLGFGFSALLAVTVVGAIQFALAAPPEAEPVAASDEAQPSATVPAVTTDKPETETKPAGAAAARVAKETIAIEGVVVDDNGRPEKGVTVKLLPPKENEPCGESDAQGHFRLQIDRKPQGLSVVARTADGERQAYHQFPWEREAKKTLPSPLRLTMSKARMVEVVVVDAAHKPVPGAMVGAVVSYEEIDSGRSDKQGNCVLKIPAKARLQNLYAFKPGLGLDYVWFPTKEAAVDGEKPTKLDASPAPVLTLSGAKTARIKLVDPEGKPVPAVELSPWYFAKESRPDRGSENMLNISSVAAFHAKTGADGVAVFDWLPVWNTSRITFWHGKQSRYCAPERIEFDPKSGKDELTVKLLRTVPLGGRVRFADGRPAAGIQVEATGAGYQSLDGFRESVETDADGRFEFHAYPDHFYTIVAGDSLWAAAASPGIIVHPDAPVDGVDFQLQPATKVRGQVTIGPDKKPLAGQYMSLYQAGPDYYQLPPEKQLANPTRSNRAIMTQIARWATTDADGRYEFSVGPGKYNLHGPANSPTQTFSVGNEKSFVFDFHTPRPDRGTIAGRVVLQGKDAQPVANAEITGVSQAGGGYFDATSDAEGRFSAERSLSKAIVQAKSKDGKLAGTAEISGDDKEVTIPVQPTIAAEGRLLDATKQKPLAGREMQYGVRVCDLKADGTPTGCFSNWFGGTVTTDADGRFKLAGLMIGGKYDLDVVIHAEGAPPEDVSWQGVGEVTVKGPGPIQLGDLQLKPPYHPPTVKERIAKAFADSTTLAVRLDAALKDAQLTQQRVLVILADPDSDACEQLYKLYFENETAQDAFADYRLIAVNAKGDKANEATTLLKTRLGVQAAEPVLLVFDVDGKPLAAAGADQVSKAKQIDRDLLVAFLKRHAPERPDAERLLADALAQAERENKRVLVEETGAYCPWCVVLSRFLESQKEILAPDYVTIKIDRSRFRNGQKVMSRLRTKKEGGIPWMAILDAKGKTLVTSDGPKGNIGFPGEPAEIEYFLKMLTDTAQRFTPAQIAALRTGLDKRPAKPATSHAKTADAAAQPGSMRVRVLDQQGKPLQGVNVHSGIWTEEKGVKGNHDYKTDSQGQAIVELPKTYFIVRLFVTKDSYVPLFRGWEQEWLTANRLPDEHTFTMRKGTVIGGVVKNEDGKPIAGAKVEVSCDGADCLTWLADGDDARLTDAQGRWTLDDVPEGDAIRLSLRLNHPDYVSDQAWGGLQNEQDVTLASLRAKTAKIVMHRGVSISGTVTAADGKPVANAVVAWGDDPYFEKSGIVHEVKTDANGIYRIPTLKPGPMTVTVMAEGSAPDLKKITIAKGNTTVDFQLKRAKTIRLQFVDTAGKPIPGVTVQIESWRGGKSLYNIRHPNVLDSKIPETADKNGVWQWTWAPDDPVKLSIYSYPLKGYAGCGLEIAGGAPPRTITLKPEHHITGRVTDAVTGKPIPAFTVVPLDVFRKDWLCAERDKAKNGKDGRLEYLATRTDIPLRLRIEAIGYRNQNGPEFRLGDDNARNQDFRLQPSKPIVGVVHDANGQPAKNAKVFVATPTEWISLEREFNNHELATDASGGFKFPDPGERFTIVATTDAGFAMADFAADQHNAGTLQLQPWATVRGRLLDGGQPVKRATVFVNLVRLDNLDQPRVETNDLQVRTDKDGRFVFAKVPPVPASVRVHLGPWEDPGFRSGPSVPLDLKPGQQVELNLGGAGATVKGKVTLTGKVPADLNCTYSLNHLIRRSPGIEPPPSIAKTGFDIRKGWQSACLNTQEGCAYLSTLQHWFVKLAPDGSFRISGVPAGEYVLSIEIYAKPKGCLIDPLAKKILQVIITPEDSARGELTLPEITATVVPIPMVGDTPSLDFQHADGSSGSLADFRGQNTVVHFWASWCGPCKQQLPALRHLQERLAARGFATLGLSLDNDMATWQAAIKQLDLPWPQGRVSAAINAGVSSGPAYWLLDPAGKLVAKVDDPDELAAALNKVEPKPAAKEKKPDGRGDSTPKAGSVRISAVDRNGKPIPGAAVKIEGGDATVTAESITLKAPADITATRVKVERGDTSLVAKSITLKAPSAIGATGAKTLTNPPDRYTRSRTASLLVRVVDEDGKPLANTNLDVKFLGHEKNCRTDAEGTATVVVPGPNRLFLSLIAYPDGYPPMRKWWKNEAGNELIPHEFTFTFERGRTIGGVVRDEQGKPIQGAKIHLSISSEKLEQSQMCLALWNSIFVTDAEGRWSLAHVPLKIKSLSVGLEHPDFISSLEPAGISTKEQQQIENGASVMVMKKGIPMTGTVTDPEGKPVADASVILGEWHGSDRPKATTDQQGHYRFASLAPGSTVLTVIKPGLAPALRNIDVQPQIKPVDLRLEKGNSLRVRVVDKDGKPIAGIFVTPDTWRGRRVLCELPMRGHTDAEGRWAWTWAPKDAVQTNLGLTGYVNYMSVRNLPLVAQEAEHVITMFPALTISGHVIDADTKQPVPSFRVVQGRRQEGDWERSISWDRYEVVEGKDGQYKLTITQPSLAHLVRIEADGRQPAVSREFKSDEGNVTCDFALNKGKDLNVMVRLADGKPAAGADVCLCPETPGKFINMAMFVKNGGFPYRDSSRPFLKVGPDGRLLIPPQDNGFLLIIVHDQGFLQTTSKELIAKAEATLSEALIPKYEITLQAWARLEGIVRHGTKPVPGVKVVVDPAGPYDPKWGFLSFQEQTEADADGKFVFPKLKPGKWWVRVLPAKPNQAVPVSPEQRSPVDLAPGKTVHLAFGGEGRPVAARIQWPGGKPPEGDLSKIVANVRPKMPEPAAPPKEIRDQGPDAARAWMKQWQESPEGKAWRATVRQQAQCPRTAPVDSKGSLRIEETVPGRYELGIYVIVKDDTLPWDHPDLLCYEGEFSVPEIPGGVSDQPLDVGNVLLTDRSPKKLSFDSVKPPAPQAPGEKTTGGLRDNLELLRYVVMTYRQNKAKLQTWQGKAAVESRVTYEKMATGNDYVATVQFVFDRSKKSIRWNDTLEKWARITQGHEEPQPVPQILNGMMTPQGLYRLGQHDSPGNPARRPLVLTIYSQSDSFGRLQPQNYDFNPLYYLDTPRGDVARDISGYLGMIDHPGISRIKVIREGDQVTIDMSMDNIVQRYTLSLNQGCNPISYETIEPNSTWTYRWTYEKTADVWLPKTWSETVHAKDGRDERRKVTFVESLVNQPVEPAAFSLPRLGLQVGDKVQDRRTEPMKQYSYDGEIADVRDLPDPPPPR